jgi:hypothetical protein
LPAGVSVLKIVGHEAPERGGILFDRSLRPAERSLADESAVVRRNGSGRRDDK